MVDMLSQMVEGAVGGGFISSFPMGFSNNRVIKFSHLIFVGDTFIFWELKYGQVQSSRALVLCFEAAGKSW